MTAAADMVYTEVARDLIVSGNAPEGMTINGSLYLAFRYDLASLPNNLTIMGDCDLSCFRMPQFQPGKRAESLASWRRVATR